MRLWYPVLFLYLWISILGPLVWSTTSAVTLTAASWVLSTVTSAPSTRRSAVSDSSLPTRSVTLSTSRTSPTATLCCLPPWRTIAYTAELLAVGRRGALHPV